MVTKQVDLWRSEFGADYAERGNNRISGEGQRLLMRDWGKMLAHAVTPAPQSVLEVGCNIGRNLLALRHFVPELHGIEPNPRACAIARGLRSEEHTSELKSLMRISYAAFCLKKKKQLTNK